MPRGIAPLRQALERDFPDFPEYWAPSTELDYEVTLTDDRPADLHPGTDYIGS